ncbi:uncharacterized protein LOC110991317 [Pieris rapae]|uniref:uncharacterized protein LOC110991317 n=1 Tax=Pieris rapae TaxID=64459 RepID=UPI001E27B2E4|nr:uncharacterized protein LOC110991317 [Pieris rapae]
MEEVQNSPWRNNDGSTVAVLQAVFWYMSPSDLSRAAAVCQIWRRVASADFLWRHSLMPHITPDALRTLRNTSANNQHIASWQAWSWRREGALATARWTRRAKLLPTAGAPLLHIALDQAGTHLALLAEQAQLSVWVRDDSNDGAAWHEVLSKRVSDEWGFEGAAEWAPNRRRLLIGGPLILADRWEFLVLDFTADWHSSVVCRASSSPGTWPNWLDDAHFITFHARLAAPHCATTTVCINATTQGTHSEYVGVLAPLLRIYNEAGANITHTLVVDLPESTSEDRQHDESPMQCREPHALYYRCLREKCDSGQRYLIVSGGLRGGIRGEARALLGWKLPASFDLPPVFLREGIAERILARRQRDEEPPEEPPGEEALRALCSLPEASCPLPATVLGLVLHPSGRSVWVTTTDGIACVSLPVMQPALWLPLGPKGASLYRVQPHADHDYVVSPVSGGSGVVEVWSVRSGVHNASLVHENPALAALLLPSPPSAHTLLVLTTEALHIWQSCVQI